MLREFVYYERSAPLARIAPLAPVCFDKNASQLSRVLTITRTSA